MVDKKSLKGTLDLDKALEDYKFKKAFKKLHPEYFDPDGILIFTGIQGSGKTLSAVSYIWKLTKKYPEVEIVSNCHLSLPGYEKPIKRYTGFKQVKYLDNGYKGIILFLDEIQSEFNSLESKLIDPSWFQIISMQRKRRLHVVGTSQLYSRIAKPWREQFHNVVECSCILGTLQVNRMIDCNDAKEINGELIYKTSKPFFWFHDPKLYDMYDTWERVKKVEDIKKV